MLNLKSNQAPPLEGPAFPNVPGRTRFRFLLVLVAAATLSGALCFRKTGLGPGSTTTIMSPHSVVYGKNRLLRELTFGRIFGNRDERGLWGSYIRFRAGAKALPNMEADDRAMIVVSGTLYAGVGMKWVDADLKPVTVGNVLVIPARTPFYAMAKDGDVLVIEVGDGPTNTVLIPQEPAHESKAHGLRGLFSRIDSRSL